MESNLLLGVGQLDSHLQKYESWGCAAEATVGWGLVQVQRTSCPLSSLVHSVPASITLSSLSKATATHYNQERQATLAVRKLQQQQPRDWSRTAFELRESWCLTRILRATFPNSWMALKWSEALRWWTPHECRWLIFPRGYLFFFF